MKTPTEQELLNDPSISYWLKGQVQSSKSRDCLDALLDAEILVEVLKERVRQAGIPVR